MNKEQLKLLIPSGKMRYLLSKSYKTIENIRQAKIFIYHHYVSSVAILADIFMSLELFDERLSQSSMEKRVKISKIASKKVPNDIFIFKPENFTSGVKI